MPDPRMAEHFRCDRLKLTLSRSSCAVQHIRGVRQQCVGCEIGARHKAGEPHVKAPALVPIKPKQAPLMGAPRSVAKPSAFAAKPAPLAAPKPAPRVEPKPPRLTVAQERAAAVTRDRTARCMACAHEMPCATMGRLYACPKCGGKMQRMKLADVQPPASAEVVVPKPAAPAPRPQAREQQARCALDLCGKPCPPGERYCSNVCERDDAGQPVLILSVKLDEGDHALVTAAAKRAGMAVATWARAALLGAAAITGGVR